MRYNQKQPKQRKTVNFKENGFKPIKGQPGYFINILGIAFDSYSGREMTICQGKYYRFIKADGLTLYLTVAKIVLQAFGNKPYLENKHVIFKDGNKRNFFVDNLKYQQESYEPVQVDKTALLTAIRCYFPVPENFKPILKNGLVRIYLNMIVYSRFFDMRPIKHMQLFKEYLKFNRHSNWDIAKKRKIPLRDYINYINELINQLCSEVVTDLKTGKLMLQPFELKETPKQRERRVLLEFKNLVDSIRKQ